MAAILVPRGARSESGEVSASLELLRRWVAGDEAALQEWLRAGPPREVDHTRRRAGAPPGGKFIGRRGGARYKYPVEGR